MDDRLESVRQRIALLAAIDPDLQVFGASTHRYAFAPPLTAEQLVALERSLGVALPDDARAFLRKVGASGAGPYYGLRPLAAHDAGSPQQPFPFEVVGDVVPDGAAAQDGTVVLADQGCGYASLLVVNGPHRGEVWADFTYGEGPVTPEAPSFLAWYESWIERALLEWAENAAPRIALDGPEAPAELEAVSLVFDMLAALPHRTITQERTLGYLHLREHRFEDADAAFVTASEGPDDVSELADVERTARLHRDRARLEHVRGEHGRAIDQAREGLDLEGIWYSTGDELRAILERSLYASGRNDEALEVLDARAAEAFFDFALHHRLAVERLARNDLEGAAVALERAANMHNIAGPNTTFEQRVLASFQPIIDALRAGGRVDDADALDARADLIVHAN